MIYNLDFKGENSRAPQRPIYMLLFGKKTKKKGFLCTNGAVGTVCVCEESGMVQRRARGGEVRRHTLPSARVEIIDHSHTLSKTTKPG